MVSTCFSLLCDSWTITSLVKNIYGKIYTICSNTWKPLPDDKVLRRHQIHALVFVVASLVYILKIPNLVSPALTSLRPPMAACRPRPR